MHPLRWAVLAPFFLEAYAQAQMPPLQTEFFKGTNQWIYKVSPVCGALGLGMGLEL